MMATSTRIVVVTRPFKVIALVCGLIVIALIIMALMSNDWLMAEGWRQGLFSHCIGDNARQPLPFNVPEKEAGCYPARDETYIKVSATLSLVALVTDVVATILITFGLRCNEYRTKFKFYRFSVYVMASSLTSLLVALIIYPVSFRSELHSSNREVWEFGWAYGVGWGAVIFLLGAIALLLCDKESEEIYYKERKVMST